jgi:hypothetical protein
MTGTQGPPEAAPGTDAARYRPSAKPMRVRDSQPRTPTPPPPDGRMLPGAGASATVRVTNKNVRPRPLHATGGAHLNRPGVTGSPNHGGRL